MMIDLIRTLFSNPKIENLDLTKKEDFDKYNNLIDDLEKIKNENKLFSNIITDDFIVNIRNIGKDIYEQNQNKNVNNKHTCSCCCKKKEIDKSEEVKNSNDNNESFVFPSESIKDVNVKMQIHRLTQEYVDNMLKPYLSDSKNKMNDINNAYTALFEFACWIFNK